MQIRSYLILAAAVFAAVVAALLSVRAYEAHAVRAAHGDFATRFQPVLPAPEPAATSARQGSDHAPRRQPPQAPGP